MKKHSFNIFSALVIVLNALCACSKFDDSALWQAINKNAADIAALQKKTDDINSDIFALQQLVATINNRDFITDCTPLADGTGYTVAFNSGKSIVINNGRNGTNGKDGSTPQIGVVKDTDGIYYWTMNDSWLLDAAGNKVKADGKDGTDGISPKFKIEDGYWYLSTGNQSNWENIGRAVGEDGEDGKSFFENVIIGIDTVTFVLADGTTLVVPLKGSIEMVDLGLPSGLKWASCNLGALKPEEYGGYYQWAGLQDITDTTIYIGFEKCPYHTGLDEYSGWTKYISSYYSSYWSGDGGPDNKYELDPDDDVVNVKLGDKWRIPTIGELNELLENCISEWTTLNGVNGRKFTSKKNGNSIFLPATGDRWGGDFDSVGSSGHYWSSTLRSGMPVCAYELYFNSDYAYESSSSRCLGRSVRPVSK